ncbi:MAG: hypothetical protein RMI04_08565 [Thermofilaceae archaeon]|nr:hypothetical protein [Thermofilaceae archaeon]
MWWVFPGFVAGLLASSLMIVYWLCRLRYTMAEKGWRYTSRLWIFAWIALFFGSTSGILRESTTIQHGSAIDNMLFYISATLYWFALLAMITGLILDALIKTRKV